MENGEERSLLILGLGNVLCSDDGLGIAATAEIERRYAVPSMVRVVDGGTLGMALMSIFEDSQDVILVDAIQADESPGSLVRVEGEAVPPAVRTRLSVHQIGVADLLEGLRLVGSFPRSLVLLGLVPESLELAVGSSPAVLRNLPLLVESVAAEARRLGYPLEPLECCDSVTRGFYCAAGSAPWM